MDTYPKIQGFENECVTRVIFTPDCVIFVVSERRTSDIRNRSTISNVKTCSLKDGRWNTAHIIGLTDAGIGDVVCIDGVLRTLPLL